MVRNRRPNLHGGFILTEACVSLVLVGLVLGGATLLLARHAGATEYFLNYRRAQLAAESCVERLRIGTLDVGDQGFSDDAGIRYRVRVMEAPAEWQPLRKVEVTAFVEEQKFYSAQYALRTYLAPAVCPEGGNP